MRFFYSDFLQRTAGAPDNQPAVLWIKGFLKQGLSFFVSPLTYEPIMQVNTQNLSQPKATVNAPYASEVPVMAIFWKGLNELDVYSANKVRTYRGTEADMVALSLRQERVSIEEME